MEGPWSSNTSCLSCMRDRELKEGTRNLWRRLCSCDSAQRRRSRWCGIMVTVSFVGRFWEVEVVGRAPPSRAGAMTSRSQLSNRLAPRTWKASQVQVRGQPRKVHHESSCSHLQAVTAYSVLPSARYSDSEMANGQLHLSGEIQRKQRFQTGLPPAITC